MFKEVTEDHPHPKSHSAEWGKVKQQRQGLVVDIFSGGKYTQSTEHELV